MTGEEYRILAARTINYQTTHNDRMINAALGLTGEAGEVADLIKKNLFQGHVLDAEHVAKELGDVMWYIALMCTTLGLSLDTVMETNIAKLQGRYPEGFAAINSINRTKGDI